MAAAEAIVEHDGEDKCSKKRKEPPTETGATGDEDKDRTEQEQPQQRGTGQRKRRKDLAIYGNYKAYYGYRIGRGAPEDPRLAIFRKEWFERKDCLDIGCNQGLITIDIARKFSCQSILGVDIDKGLIETALWNLRKAIRMVHASCHAVVSSEAYKLKESKSFEKEDSPDSNGKLLNCQCNPESEDIDKRVSFLHENFVQSDIKCSEKYDTILCLSVTKWIHLNWGDDGLINLFVKIWRLLRPGGVLILEPQPWSSYKRNRTVSQVAVANYNTIQLHPSQFCEVLLDKVGFRSAEVITESLAGTVMGFDRPIVVFYK